MTSKNLYSSFTSLVFVRPALLHNAVEYLIQHPYLFLDETETSRLTEIKNFGSTLLTELAERVLKEGPNELFSFFRAKSSADHVPELLTLRQIPLDLVQAYVLMTPAFAGALITQPHLSNRILLNVTPFTLASGQLSDSIGFQSAVVRDALMRSYYNNDKSSWISPSFTQFVSKVYSMTMGTSVSQIFRLDVKTLNILTFFFAYFYLGMIVGTEPAQRILSTQWKNFFVPDSNEQVQLLGHVQQTLSKESLDSLDDVIAVIQNLGIPRVQLSRKLLIDKLRSSFSSEVFSTSLALDYPPALAHLIICAFSGIPIPLSHKLKSLGLQKSKATFEESILRSPEFVSSLTER